MRIPIGIHALVVGNMLMPSMLVVRTKTDTVDNARKVSIPIDGLKAALVGAMLEKSDEKHLTIYDTLAEAIHLCGGEVIDIVIADCINKEFSAQINVVSAGASLSIPTSPAHALALALKLKVPMFIEEQVLDIAEKLHQPEAHEPSEEELSEFRSFLDSISPEDFD